MNATVLVVTLNRPDCVRQCLRCLAEQDPPPHQVIVIDASIDDRTRDAVAAFPTTLYLRNPTGFGHMTQSRNIGLQHATGDIIAFIDDDAFVHPHWLDHLLRPYADPTVGGVGGRALNNQPGETERGVEQIGRLLPNGALTGNFAADPGKVIEVDHIIGCNMSWRADVLSRLGGLRDDYPGTEVREETDIALRVRKLGFRILFQPGAVVTHVGAPQVKGRRFDGRYAYYHARNHAMLIVRNFGPFSSHALRSTIREVHEFSLEAAKRIGMATCHLAARSLGLTVGLIAGCWCYLREHGKPFRRPSSASPTTSLPERGSGSANQMIMEAPRPDAT